MTLAANHAPPEMREFWHLFVQVGEAFDRVTGDS